MDQDEYQSAYLAGYADCEKHYAKVVSVSDCMMIVIAMSFIVALLTHWVYNDKLPNKDQSNQVQTTR